MKSKIFNIPSVGEIIVTKHYSSKKITLKLRPEKLPKVVIPQLMTYKMGYNFALEKKEWILENLEKIKRLNPNRPIYDYSITFKTRFTSINFESSGKKLVSVRNHNIITLKFPENTDITSQANQTIIKNFIIEILRSEAKKHLIPRVDKLANYYNFKYKKVYIKNLKTRWGSCSSTNNINLNLALMLLPEHLSDFIILHELCHTVYKNHGKNFHELLNTITGDEKQLNKELRNYSIESLI